MNTVYNNDTFKYENIFPVRIVKVSGNVSCSETLLEKKELQITTNEPETAVLSNKKYGKRAEIILDFGKELHGKIRILTYTIDGEAPAKIRVTYGESVSEAMSDIGYKGSTNDHATRDTVFSFPEFSDISLNESGFRFARLSLISKNTTVRLKSVAAVSVLRDIPYLGSFRCSDELLNKIYDTCAYTCHLNMQQYIWDGIKRDRLVWVGDMHPEMLTVRTVFGANNIINKSLNFMREQTPLPLWMNGMPTYSLWWLHILYDWYFYTGDAELLEDNKSYATQLIRIIVNLVNDDGTENLPSYFLDWPCNNKPQGVTGSRALLAIALESSAALSEIFNENELKNACLFKKNCLLKTVPESYGAKQVTAMLSLADWKDKNEAAKDILSGGASGWSTFMSYYLLKAAKHHGMNETLDALKEYYGGMLDMGATSFWEDFDISWLNNAAPIDKEVPQGKSDIHGDNGAFCYKGLRHSLCHGWSSAPTAFLAEEVLGINIIEAGCKKIRISPDLGSLDFAEGTFPTPYGILYVKCTKEENRIKIEYNAPENIDIIL